MIELSVPFQYPDDEPEERRPNGIAVRAVLEIILRGRTHQNRAIRAELLRRKAEGMGAVESIGQLARRLKVSRRRIEQVQNELLTFAYPTE